MNLYNKDAKNIYNDFNAFLGKFGSDINQEVDSQKAYTTQYK